MSPARTLLTLLAAVIPAVCAIAGPLAIESVDRRPLTLEGYPRQQQVTVRFRNALAEPDPSAWVILPVPVGFELVGGSMHGPGATVALSTDGGETFLPESEWAPDALAQVTHVRWEFPGPVEAGVSGIVSLRLRPVSAPEAISPEQE